MEIYFLSYRVSRKPNRFANSPQLRSELRSFCPLLTKEGIKGRLQIHYNFGVNGARGLFIEGRGEGMRVIPNPQAAIPLVQTGRLRRHGRDRAEPRKESKAGTDHNPRLSPFPGLISPQWSGGKNSRFFVAKPPLLLERESGRRPDAPLRVAAQVRQNK